MNEKQPTFNDIWKPVEGLEHAHEVMTGFATQAADKLIEMKASGQDVMIASFMNGGMASLAYLFSELNVRLAEGTLDRNTFMQLALSTALFETTTIEIEGYPPVRELVPGIRFLEGLHKRQQPFYQPDQMVVVDDIFETSRTLKALTKLYPTAPLTLMSPVIKDCTEGNLEGINYDLLYNRQVRNAWIDTSCGLNGGINFIAFDRYGNNQLNVSQRYNNVGYWHHETDDVSGYGEIHAAQIAGEQLPWVDVLGLRDNFLFLESLKNGGHTAEQLTYADALLLRFVKMNYDEAAEILGLTNSTPRHTVSP